MGAFLRGLREEAGETPAEAAASVNISRQRLWLIEQGRAPYGKVARLLIGRYGARPDRVLRDATGQLELELVRALGVAGPGAPSRDRRLGEHLTRDEKTAVEAFLIWYRLCREGVKQER